MIIETGTTVGAPVLTEEQRCKLFTDIHETLKAHKKGAFVSLTNELVDSLAHAIPHFKTKIMWKTDEVGRPPKPENEILMSDCADALERAGLDVTDWNDRSGNESLLYKIYRVMASQIGIMAPDDLSPLFKHKQRGIGYKAGERKITRNR